MGWGGGLYARGLKFSCQNESLCVVLGCYSILSSVEDIITFLKFQGGHLMNVVYRELIVKQPRRRRQRGCIKQ